MFSGITQGLYPIAWLTSKPGLTHYQVALDNQRAAGLQVGASVAIDGVCQSVTCLNRQGKQVIVSFDAIEETLSRTTLASLKVNQWVSVERSLRFGDEIGGHLLAGHIIGTGTIKERSDSTNNLSLTISCPAEWMPCILPKGFIAVDGSSLTVGDIDAAGSFQVHLIPETLRLTNLGNKQIGDQVNIELDQQTQAIVASVQRVLASQGVIGSTLSI
jgi:riboflavin synthase